MLMIALVLLVISIFRFSSFLGGSNVQDLGEATAFLNEEPVPVTKMDVQLIIMGMSNQIQKPAPIVLPKPSSGTTMIKGGGGNGTRK